METSVDSKHNDEGYVDYDLDRRWDFSTSSDSRAFDLESWSYVKHENYHLQLLQKKETLIDRPIIPATAKEKLAYLRCYVSTPSKTQIIPIQLVSFNLFFWSHIFTLFFKSLPTSYITLFLSSYAPKNHFYLSKMVPWFSGSTTAIIFCGVFELAYYSQYIMYLFYYTICGFLFKSPWFGCDFLLSTSDYFNVTCISPEGFLEMHANKTPNFDSHDVSDKVFITPEGKRVLMSPILFYRQTMQLLSGSHFMISVCLRLIIVTIASIDYKIIFKRFLWRFLDQVHLMVNIIYFVTTMHLIYSYFESKKDIFVNGHLQVFKLDLGVVSESITAPPVLHVLTSRSMDQVKPGRDSGILMASNTIYYIFRGVLLNRIKKYSETAFNAPILLHSFLSYPDLYLIPFYFSTFYFGSIFTLIYYTSNLLMELVTFIITYQCLLEAIVCEWPKCKRLLIILLINITILMGIIDQQFEVFIYIISKGITSIMEIMVICWIYPLGRLIDDITFHLGTVPLNLRILNIKMLPFYYTVNIYFAIWECMKLTKYKIPSSVYSTCIFILSPVLLEFIWNYFKNVLSKKSTFKDLVRPLPSFGPLNHLSRQLRKQYDSREFITSQSSRYLSRYLMAKAEADTYKLDVQYLTRRSTAFRSPEMRKDSDKTHEIWRRRSTSARKEFRISVRKST